MCMFTDMEIYVYGPVEIKSVCGWEVKALQNVEDVFNIPRNAILYVDSLKEAKKIKQMAPWITVRTMTVEVTNTEEKFLDVYELIREIVNWGTCRVCVPDATLRQALTSILQSLKFETSFLRILSRNDDDNEDVLLWHISFEETCKDTYSCPELYSYIKAHARSRLMSPIIDVKLPEKISTCITIGTPGSVEWDYYLDYPDMSPEELTTMLSEKKLKFRKIVPKLKLLEDPCNVD